MTLLKVAILVVIAGWTWYTGHRGMFGFDQSIVFDGAWRICSGQVPYRDFHMAFTPLSFAIQAFFFQIAGVAWSATVISAAFVGCAAALSTMRTVRLLFGAEQRVLIALTGLLTGGFIQSVFGTLWIENTAFLFTLLGLQAVAEATRLDGRRQRMAEGLAGICAALSFLCKQNVGVLSVGFLALLILALEIGKPKRILPAMLWYGTGGALIGGLFAAWLIMFSSPVDFLHHAVEIPGSVGAGRANSWLLLNPLFLFARIPGAAAWNAILSIIAFVNVIFLFRGDAAFRTRFLQEPATRVASAALILVPYIQYLFGFTTMNGFQNLTFLSALTVAMAAGFYLTTPELAAPHCRASLLLAGVAALFLTVEGVESGKNRVVHDLMPQPPVVERTLRTPGLTNLGWIRPNLGELALTADDFDGVNDWLSKDKRPFLVLGDHSLLYGLHGVVPPQPLLYFQDNHYYTTMDFSSADYKMLESLKSGKLKVVVLEKVMYVSQGPQRTREWVATYMTKAATFGIFDVYVSN